MRHIHDNKPPSVDNDGERPDHGHQADEDDTDNAICDIRAFMFNVSIQPKEYEKILKHSNNDNAPSDVSFSFDPKRHNRQLTLLLKNEIPTSWMDLEGTHRHVPKFCSSKEKIEHISFAETNIPEES